MTKRIGTRGKRLRSIGRATIAVAFVLAMPTVAAARPNQAKTSVRVTVSATQTYSDTGLALRAGESVTIRAAGRVRFISGGRGAAGPAGIAWGRACDAVAGASPRKSWPAPGQRCWSLIGRVGAGVPFEIGAAKTFTTPAAGVLFLGINDNHVDDNRGAWTVAITRATPGSPITVPATPATPTSKSSSSVGPILEIAAGLVVAALLVGWVLARRRRSKGESPAEARTAEVVDVPTVVTSVVAPVGASAPTTLTPGRSPAEAFDPTSTDVNIFRVEVSQTGLMTVGYSFFPEGTVVHWRVVENGAASAAGEFVTEGGGGAKHVAELTLGITFPADAAVVDLHFHWSVGDVPFDYSVRRDIGD